MLNDIRVGVINGDIIQNLCSSLLVKEPEESKIDIALKSIVQQKMFYPLYPPNIETPIEYS